ncbi:hypothetical protein, partial [Lactiplantibacillus pentosus]|uniref:hypothetical protein n=1 Tax=Lactiplantibacillus pentosus TaxID=1589 RepID=UPI0021A8BAE1
LKLRSGVLREFKSMSALFQRCQPAPEVGIGRASADEQQSNLAFLIIIRDKLTHTICLLPAALDLKSTGCQDRANGFIARLVHGLYQNKVSINN